MIKLEERKLKTEDKPIEKMPLPGKVYIPLSQHLGKICNALEVKIGDLLLSGQRIAKAEAHVYSPIHASVSGKVISLQDWPHPVLGRCKTIVIESDGKDENSRTQELKNSKEIGQLTPEKIREIVFEAGIVGMGGAGFPSHIKLKPPKPVDTLIINGAECEPYLTSDYRLMIEKTEGILRGIELVARCLGVEYIYIAIEDNKPDAIKAFNSVIGYRLSVIERTRNSEHRTPIALKVLKSQYPQGGEKQLIKNILGKEVPSGKLPFDIGVVVHNVATAYAIYEAVYMNKPLYERVVTVTGSCISSPKNVFARIGTPIKELIAFCAPLKEEPAKIIIGGPMMGIAQYSQDVPIIKTTTGVILLTDKESRTQKESFCLRCGECINSCPMGLQPCLINLATEAEDYDKAGAYGALDCIECGLCNYVCPARRNLVQSIKVAKNKLIDKG